ncbi:MAG: hypothetical protein ACLFRB_06845 [Thiohalorhabdus sp.]|uniref:hypothetical protein n=1 Tax=Thiohalorhabdus sp. TaxID=3094134 RepID=UPI003980D5DD
MREARHFLLDSGSHEGAIRFLGDRVEARELAEGQRKVVTVTRAGTFFDPRYGEFEISRKMLQQMVENFDNNVYGQEVALDVSHRPQDGAAGWIRRLFLDGNKLRAEVEFTSYGLEAVRKRGMIYLSAEFHENYRDNETGKAFGPTLLGAALTPRPVIKRLDPIQLAEGTDTEHPTLVSDRVKRILSEESTAMWEKLLKELAEKLGNLGLAEDVIKQLQEGLQKAGEGITDEDQARKLMESFEATGKQLAEQLPAGDDGAGRTINLSIQGGGQGLSQEDITKLLDEREAEREKKRQAQAQALETLQGAFRKKLDESESIKALSEEEAKAYYGAADLITAEMTEAQVAKLAEQQIAAADQLVATKKLSGMGYGGGPGGSVRITPGEQDEIKSLQERMDERLGLSGMSEARRFRNTGGSLQPDNKALAEKVLAQYDALHGQKLYQEHKALAGGEGELGDVDVPASWERTVIREALYELIGTQFIDSDTAEFASSMMIPYSYRDTDAAGRDNTRVYEGEAIRRAGVIQTAETAYPLPQKLAFLVSDELRYLTSAGRINWEAVAENQRNASRIIREDTEQLIFNEILRAADEHSAVEVTGEDLSDDLDGTNNVFPLANFPVVRPRKTYDLQGNQVGSTSHPITVTYNGDTIDEYDGTGDQDSGDYYEMDYNLGEIRIVDETGSLRTPSDGDTLEVDYHYVSNVYAFNTDLDDADEADHWDRFLYRYGLRKSVLEDDRYHMADFGLMSGNLMTRVEQAKRFEANSKRPGTDLAADGNLGRVKDVPNYKTKAPGLWMGDQRAIIGERGITRMRMMRPWQMGDLENAKDSNGRYTGQKEAYGDQFLVLHTPTELKRAYTSIVTYSDSDRTARAE